MWIDVSPLRKHRDFRLLFIGQGVSFLGSMMTYVAVPYQVYELTKSSWLVGMVSAAQLVPVLLFGLLGGAIADSFDRRRLLLVAESAMSVGALVLALNATLASPSVALIFVVAALMQAVNAFHRPAMDAMTQNLVEAKEYAAIGALGSLRSSIGAILGPALGGVLMAWGGAKTAFWVDFGTFAASVGCIALMRATVAPDRTGKPSQLKMIGEALAYIKTRPELIGTYVVDIVAMTFAFPVALFPQMAQTWGGPKAAGVLMTAMSVGALLMSAVSGWTGKVKRRGAAVVIAAGSWGVFMALMGFATSLEMAVLCLVLAGAADMMSGLFRSVIWNETIPNEMRGRLAGAEMISYMSGPLLGNARAGWMAAAWGVSFSLTAGGVLCVVGVLACALTLRRFWRYQSLVSPPSAA